MQLEPLELTEKGKFFFKREREREMSYPIQLYSHPVAPCDLIHVIDAFYYYNRTLCLAQGHINLDRPYIHLHHWCAPIKPLV